MGLFSRNKKVKDAGFLSGATDYHSHILPGVDDGFRTLEDSLEALSIMESYGVSRLWLTPHIMEEFPNEPARLREIFEELRQAYTGKIQLNLAAENMLDPLFEERLRKGNLLPIGEKGDHLLVETSYFTPPHNFRGLLRQIKIKGLQPLLAHPERYIYMNKEDYDDLHAEGIKFQINYGSLGGFYGDAAKQKAEWLLKKGYINVFGSDSHNLKYVNGITESEITSGAAKRMLEIAKNSI